MTTVKVVTRFNADQIQQHLEYDGHDPIEPVFLEITLLKDEGVRQALIQLGWAPPPGMRAREVPRGGEDQLRQQLVDLHREHQKRCEPIVRALAHYEALRPPAPLIVDLDKLPPGVREYLLKGVK